MNQISPGLAAHKGARGQVLLELRHDQPLAASELAKRLNVTVTAVRRHLKELELEGLIDYHREQRGQGAPTFAFRLTSGGEALFPNRYQETVSQLLEHLVAHDGRPAAVTVVKGQYAELKRKVGPLDGLSRNERLEAVVKVLGEAGFMAEFDSSAGFAKLNVYNCAIPAVAARLPETCDFELEFLRDSLGAEVHRKTHILSGCNTCEYMVNFKVGEPDSGSGAPRREDL